MKVATFDIETNGLLEETTRVWCACIKDHNTGDIKSFTPDNIRNLPDLLDTFDILIGHNCIAFDFPVLKKIFGWTYHGQTIDTVLMSRLQRPSRRNPPEYIGRAPHSVEAWGHRLGVQKQEHKEWDRYSGAMLERCRTDVALQYNIYEALLEEGKEQEWDYAHRLNARIFQHLHEQEQYGFTINTAHLEKSVTTLDRWMEKIERALASHLPYIIEKKEIKKDGEYGWVKKPFRKDGGYSASVVHIYGEYDINTVAGPFSRIVIRPISLDSTIEVKDFLLAQGWQPEKWNEKDGQRTSPNLSKDDGFKGIRGALGRLVVKRIQCRQRKSVLEGWRNSCRADGRLATRVSGIATTGRLRHSVVVNIPSPHSGAFFAKQMRQCFIARIGWKLVGADSKGNQMRQLAARMNDEEFTEAVLHGSQEEGTDLHSLNQKRSGAATRSLAKNFFYGSILFGAGDKKTAELLDTTREKAKAIKEKYMSGMPKLKAVLEELSKEWRITAQKRYSRKYKRIEYVDGYIKGIDKRPILVPYEKDLLCYALQSDEAIHMGVAYVMVHKRAEQRGWTQGVDWGMLIWMHDEFQMECRPEIADELGQLACDAIAWAGEWLGISCLHDGDYMIGNNWYETH